MDDTALVAALHPTIPEELARDLTQQFLDIRRDVATGTLGRSSPGKFVEGLVQVLQSLERGGQYDAQPKVDDYLKNLESRRSNLPDGLRICAARIGRGMYSLRSKRNIVHKAQIDPAHYDLHLLYAGAQWTLAELLSLASGITGDHAARLVSEVQLPVGELVEAIDGRHIVHAAMTVKDEALVILAKHHPTPIRVEDLKRSMDRRAPGSVTKAVTALWKEKQIHRDKDGLAVLTEAGLRRAIETAQKHAGG